MRPGKAACGWLVLGTGDDHFDDAEIVLDRLGFVAVLHQLCDEVRDGLLILHQGTERDVAEFFFDALDDSLPRIESRLGGGQTALALTARIAHQVVPRVRLFAERDARLSLDDPVKVLDPYPLRSPARFPLLSFLWRMRRVNRNR